MNIITPQKTSIRGQYRIEVKRAGVLIKETDWFDNLILNNGLDLIGSTTSNLLTYCQVGTGTSTPTVSQTTLDTKSATSPTGSHFSSINSGSPNYTTERVVKYIFTQGSVLGNMTEIGVGPLTTGGLFSRALIVDTNGDPTVLTLIAIDQLIIYYKLTLIPPLGTSTGSLNISGTTHSYVQKCINLPNFFTGSTTIGGLRTQLGNQYCTVFQTSTYTSATVIASSSSGTSGGVATPTTSYNAGSYTAVYSYVIPIASGNFASGLIGIDTQYGYAINGGCKFNVTFDVPIMKTSTQTFTYTSSISWARV